MFFNATVYSISIGNFVGEWHILDENIIEYQVNHNIIYCNLLLNIMVKLNFEKWKKSKMVNNSVFLMKQKRRRKTVDNRVQERKQQALKKHPLAVKLDINCKGLTHNTNSSLSNSFSNCFKKELPVCCRYR